MKKSLLMSAVLAAFTVPSMAMAQDADPNTGAISFGADLNFTTSYFFRGYNQEDTGLIFQPNIYATTQVIDSDNFDLTAKVGLWSSLHTEQTASDDIWYEADIYGLLTASFAGNYYATLGYTLYTYPGDAFEAIQEFGLSGGVADATDFWDSSEEKNFTMPVEIGFYKETDDGNGEQDFYWELKAIPTLATDAEFIPGMGSATLSFPLILGGSLDGYYTDDEGGNETFGYFSVGVNVGLPIGTDIIPARYGNWTLNAGVNYIYLMADSAEAANDGGEDYELQGMVGVSVSY
jgi:hypothetical protein